VVVIISINKLGNASSELHKYNKQHHVGKKADSKESVLKRYSTEQYYLKKQMPSILFFFLPRKCGQCY